MEENTNGEVICASIIQKFSSYSYQHVCNSVKHKTLEILYELEKQYGVLDEYGIDFSDKKVKDINATNSVINNIIISNDNNDKVKKEKWYSKIAWKIAVPIISAIIAGVIVAIIIKWFDL